MDDFEQAAAAKCLAAGYHIDPNKPFSDGRIRKAARRAQIDESKRARREAKRLERWAADAGNLERIDPRRRFQLGTDDPSEIASKREDLALLRTHLSQLQPRFRDVLSNCRLSGAGCGRYASLQGRTSSAVRSDEYRAVLELKRRCCQS